MPQNFWALQACHFSTLLAFQLYGRDVYIMIRLAEGSSAFRFAQPAETCINISWDARILHGWLSHLSRMVMCDDGWAQRCLVRGLSILSALKKYEGQDSGIQIMICQHLELLLGYRLTGNESIGWLVPHFKDEQLLCGISWATLDIFDAGHGFRWPHDSVRMLCPLPWIYQSLEIITSTDLALDLKL